MTVRLDISEAAGQGCPLWSRADGHLVASAIGPEADIEVAGTRCLVWWPLDFKPSGRECVLGHTDILSNSNSNQVNEGETRKQTVPLQGRAESL